MEPNAIAWLILAAAAAMGALLARARLAAANEDLAGLEKRLAEKDDELWTANAHLRVAALGRREDGRRIQLYRRIFAEVPVGLAILRAEDPHDPESWIIVEFNPSGLVLSGAGADNPAGRRLLDFAPEIRGTDLPRACAEAVALNRAVELPDFHSAGARVPGGRFAINAFPLGAPFIGLAFENITARKTAEESLARSNAELSQFAFVASHDLQAPLRKITSFSDHLKKHLGPRLDETGRDFLERIGRSVVGMQALIDALLELAQVDASTEEPREVDLGVVADELLADLAEELDRRGGRVERGELPVVMGDPSQLRRLLENLVGNAMKFTPPDRAPRVAIQAAPSAEGRCDLVVEDEGAGFEMGFAGRLFQPFQRLHSRKEYPGSGMGLAICRKIVERHGGAITVRSAPGRGTRFTVSLPVVRWSGREAPRLESAVV